MFPNMADSKRRISTFACLVVALFAGLVAAQAQTECETRSFSLYHCFCPELCGTVESNEVNSTCIQKGYQMYEWETEICCNGTVYPWNETSFCCGSELFDTTSQLCCDDQVYDQEYPGQLLGCCYSWEHDVSTPYDLVLELCCDGTVYVLPTESSESESDSESESESESEQVPDGISRNRTLERRRRRRFSMTNSTWRPSTTVGVEEDTTEKDDSSEEDYDDVTPQPLPYSCCKDLIYNEDTHVCCNERIQNKGGNMACCGHEFYDSHTQQCCEDFVVKDEWTTLEYAVLPIDHSRQGCCGLSAIDYATEVCCDDGPVPLPKDLDADVEVICCGNQVIVDDDSQFCCGNRVHNRRYQTTTAAATTPTSYGNATRGHHHHRPSSTHHSATINDHSTTSSHRVFHHHGGTTTTTTTTTTSSPVESIVTLELDCCLDQVYNPAESICCDGVLHPRDSSNDHVECCWNTGTLYNTKTQLCCYPEVLEAPPIDDATVGAEKTYCCLPDQEYFGRKK